MVAYFFSSQISRPQILIVWTIFNYNLWKGIIWKGFLKLNNICHKSIIKKCLTTGNKAIFVR